MYLFILHYILSGSSDIYAVNKAFFSVLCSGRAEINLSLRLLWQCITWLHLLLKAYKKDAL